MTATPTTDPIPFDIPGWTRPTWATTIEQDGNQLLFSRDATVLPLAGVDGSSRPAPITLIRGDILKLDPDTDTMTITQGPAVVHLDIEELSASEARKLAAALLELADAFERS